MARKPVDDDEDDDDDLDDAEPQRDEAEAAPADGGDEDVDPGDFEDEDDEGKRGGGLGRLILLACVALAFVVGVGAGGYFFIFRGGDETETAAAPEAGSDSADGTTMSIPRRRMMTAEELAKKGPAEPQSPAAPASKSGGAFTPPPAQQASPSQPAAAQPAAPQQQAAAPAPVEPPEAAPKGPAPAKGKGKAAPSSTAGEAALGAGLVMPSVTAAAYNAIPVLPQGKPLTGPIAGLIENTDAGQIPKTQGSQGAWRAYARPFEGPADKPKIAVIVTGMGLSRAPTLAAINQLPGGITLAFDPYAKGIEEWVGVGRSNGHEALMQLPLEASDFPVSDPGPMALLTDFEPAQNIARMHQIMAGAIGYVGLMQIMGSRFAASEAAMRPVLEEAKRRGVLFVSVPATSDDRGGAIAREIALPVATVDMKIDAVPSATAIDARLADLEKLARERGNAVAIAEAYPVTVQRLAAWAPTLDFKELFLAPVSAVASVPAPPAATKGGAKK